MISHNRYNMFVDAFKDKDKVAANSGNSEMQSFGAVNVSTANDIRVLRNRSHHHRRGSAVVRRCLSTDSEGSEVYSNIRGCVKRYHSENYDSHSLSCATISSSDASLHTTVSRSCSNNDIDSENEIVECTLQKGVINMDEQHSASTKSTSDDSEYNSCGTEAGCAAVCDDKSGTKSDSYDTKDHSCGTEAGCAAVCDDSEYNSGIKSDSYDTKDHSCGTEAGCAAVCDDNSGIKSDSYDTKDHSCGTEAGCAAVKNASSTSLFAPFSIHNDRNGDGYADRAAVCADFYREQLNAELGQGAFSVVRLAECRRTGQLVAIKHISKQALHRQPILQQLFIRECDILQSLIHPNIVRLIETLDCKDEICMVMEYVDGGELYGYVERHPNGLQESESRLIFMQLLDVLSYLHNHSIAHRDLKLENILCRFIVSQKDGDGVAPIIKLADFGFAVRFNDGKLLTERCGSEEYAAPEIIRSQPYDGRATDIWALGVILYALVTGGLPFLKDERKPRLIYQQIILSQFVFPSDIQLSDQVKDLIRRILEPDSSRRLSESIIRSHSWLLKGS